MDFDNAILKPISSFLDPGERVYWVYVFSTAAIALLVFLTTAGNRKLTQFFSFCFPKNVWRHKSTRTDIVYFVLNRVLYTLLLAPLALAIYPVINDFIFSSLSAFGEPRAEAASTGVLVAFVILALAAFDLAIYLAHLAQHKWSFLWQFHKVHHSAEALNPLTVYRMHPVDDLLTLVLGVILGCTVQAVFSFYWAESFLSIQLSVTGFAVMLFYVFGYHLRHSHIWLSYGPFFSRIFISPAQHQIHHSKEIRHRDKNLGFIFAFWDRLFGTLYVPQGRESFEVGLSSEPSHVYHSALACYARPFLDVYRQKKWAAAAVVAIFAGVATVSIRAQPDLPRTDSVFIEELTTTELSRLVAAGYSNVIIPTGGVEQNGGHLVLGKHNIVVRLTAEKIARQLGSTLVAPVIAYVPQGNIDPPEKHMRFPGTISLRESTFKALLEDATRSLLQHGFSSVYYIGDSGGNQQPQAEVAAAFQQEFADGEITVIHVGDYYGENGQFEWLRDQGYSDAQIGWHAGLRDSSELIHAAPGSIRNLAIRQSLSRPDVSGAYWRATARIGQVMVDLKTQAAIRQIQSAPRRDSLPAVAAVP